MFGIVHCVNCSALCCQGWAALWGGLAPQTFHATSPSSIPPASHFAEIGPFLLGIATWPVPKWLVAACPHLPCLASAPQKEPPPHFGPRRHPVHAQGCGGDQTGRCQASGVTLRVTAESWMPTSGTRSPRSKKRWGDDKGSLALQIGDSISNPWCSPSRVVFL